MLDALHQPWPWWLAGIIIGLTVPALLWFGNRRFGVSASLRHICAAFIPGKLTFFQYNWKKEAWSLVFVAGIFTGAVLATVFLKDPAPVQVAPALAADLARHGVTNYDQMVPADLFNWSALLSLRGFILMVVGGFLVGFGTRYAGGCTSGHAIMGLSTLQLPSLIATISFMAGGFLMTHLLLSHILAL